jgi:hypothetical protein
MYSGPLLIIALIYRLGELRDGNRAGSSSGCCSVAADEPSRAGIGASASASANGPMALQQAAAGLSHRASDSECGEHTYNLKADCKSDPGYRVQLELV